MLFSIKKHPVLRSKQFVCSVNDTWLDIGRAVEHFPRHVAGGGNDDELVEDRNARKVARKPFGVVLFEGRIDAIEERTQEGNLERIASD
jgi:hypothetical protein